jgi:hypothetical protein
MTDLQIRNGKIVYLDNNGDSVYDLPEEGFTLDATLSAGDSSDRALTVSEVKATDIVQLPVGPTSTRPASPKPGMLRFNETDDALEVYNGATWLSVTPVTSSIDYIDAEFYYNGEQGSQTSADVTLPSNQAGDMLVMFVWTDTTANQTTPTDWTLLGNGDDAEYPKSYVYGKIAVDSDDARTINIPFNASENWASIASVFRGTNPFGSFTVRNFGNVKGPSTLSTSLSSSGAGIASIAIAGLTGRAGPQDPVLTWNTKDAQVDGPQGIPSLAYKVYPSPGTATEDHALSTNDTGRQSLSYMYIELS